MARAPYAAQPDAAREEAILSLLPLVNKIAKFLSYKTRSDLGDLLGDGYVGAICAVDRFDPTRGAKLSTYAVPVIYGSIMKGIEARDPWPARARQTLRRVDRALVPLEGALGRPATEAEIERLVPGYAKARAKAYTWSVASLDAIAADGIEVRADDEGVAARVEMHDEAHYLREQIAKLPPRQRTAIIGHYFENRSLQSIADEHRVSGQAVQQAHARALARLRKTIAPTHQ